MESLILQLASWAITSALGAAIAMLASGAKGAHKRQKAMEDGMKALVRAQLFNMHEKFVVHGEVCSYDDKEQATRLFEAYKALGGNGTGAKIYNQIMEVGA